MKETQIAVIGGGPAGLCAALKAADQGVKVFIFDREPRLGGQLIKQTHKFFGSQEHRAGVRGIKIAGELEEKTQNHENISIFLNTTVIGIYEDHVLTALQNEKYIKIKFQKLIIATGAAEKMLPFENNDLPGIYGAGAVQTLMNVYGVLPGKKAVMVGAGNIGLIVSYQMLQAGINVLAVIDALPKIGGYLVHASKIARIGVPILTRHTIIRATGKEFVEGAVIAAVDENWEPVPGTERTYDCDIICLAVGLSPLIELLYLTKCEMVHVPSMGGRVPTRNIFGETTSAGVFVSGDAAGVEEASAAMMEGYISGLAAAKSLNADIPDFDKEFRYYLGQLSALRSGEVGEKIRKGLDRVLWQH
ncbi:MAG: pyridine nucleotide-disulfide oxidoreductase [Candidatus Schekmanbacteria bacterium RBG_13_48_7]|uniref:Pyridine nucleotide-disulfide oxidoreductase n=1 Tax=Candidatus Schekmanbacteria bacterium RBG_13_48_7 TaxID=1817878 RepID=A0A1F7RSI9_9BACT|nr:MAG: pyridine nucleotide-disulfide oxidoreductase [Candidatus Schekmanbacteria bacterium RBG_13_48_7]